MMDELGGKDINDVMKEMEDLEVCFWRCGTCHFYLSVDSHFYTCNIKSQIQADLCMLLLQFRASMEGKLPQHNTRIKLPAATERMVAYDGMCDILQSCFCYNFISYL